MSTSIDTQSAYSDLEEVIENELNSGLNFDVDELGKLPPEKLDELVQHVRDFYSVECDDYQSEKDDRLDDLNAEFGSRANDYIDSFIDEHSVEAELTHGTVWNHTPSGTRYVAVDTYHGITLFSYASEMSKHIFQNALHQGFAGNDSDFSFDSYDTEYIDRDYPNGE